MRRPLLLLIATLVASLLTAASEAATGWVTYRDTTARFSIATPASWVQFPPRRSAALKLAAKLRRDGDKHQAALVHAYATGRWHKAPTRVFSAVEFPAPRRTVATNVTIDRRILPPHYKANADTLRAIAGAVVKELKRRHLELSAQGPVAVDLPAGTSMRITGTVPGSTHDARSSGFKLYFVFGHGALYELAFHTDSRTLDKQSHIFERIAASLRIR